MSAAGGTQGGLSAPCSLNVLITSGRMVFALCCFHACECIGAVQAYGALLQQEIGYFDVNKTGDLTSRLSCKPLHKHALPGL